MTVVQMGEAWGLLNRWGPVLVKAVAVASAAWGLAGLLWLLSGHDRTALPAMESHHASAAVKPAIDTGRLAGLNLFGAAKASNAPAADAPDTTLQLKLNGVFMNDEPKQSSAIISEASQPTGGKLYHVDDALPSGATLSAVYEDRVMLRRSDGGTETLRFEKPSTGAVNAPPGGMPMPPGPGGFAQRSGMGGPPNVRAMLDHASDAMAQSPEAYLQSLGLQHGDHGGYEVTANAPDSVLQAGLKPGDRIVSINGQTLGNPMRDQALLQEMKTRGSARVEVQRGDQTLTIDQKF